ncbi:MAG: hypothetical protein CML56_08610 [Rhodobacteraceae bacterium]|nr:hypothetical protein [Paracoccaceae bacterium]|tara:strand:+ start:120 stop:419 length:300 start_codon:yes stop_codon:yes gene_type:complete
MIATVTNTAGILFLVENAKGRNRSVYEEEFGEEVDPSGIHVLGISLPHNDVEMRTQWFCKMKGSEDPAEIWLDVDFDALRECTTDLDVPSEKPGVTDGA